MNNWVQGLGGIFLVTAVIGCGGSSGGGTPSSLPPATKLMSLTPAQQTQLCTDVTHYTANNISKANGCKFAGVESAVIVLAFDDTTTDAALQSACSQAVTQCNSAPPDTSGSTCDFSGVAT